MADILKTFIDETGYLAALRRANMTREARNVNKLLFDAYQSQLVSIQEFLEGISNLRASGGREGEARATAEGAVQIMSVHAAKGLEFPIVVIGDINYDSPGRGNMLIDPELGLLFNLSNEEDRAAMYQMGQGREKAQAEAESSRLLYVAATRAEEMLLLSGCARLTSKDKLSSRGWLKDLGQAVDFSTCDFSEYDEAGDRALPYALQAEGIPISLTLYEPAYQTSQIEKPAATDDTTTETAVPPPLLAPITPISTDPDPLEPEMPGRVWQIVPTTSRPAAPAWLIGSLVHEALAVWRFPESDFERWLESRARGYGLADRQQLNGAVMETTRLLNRFRQHALFREMDTAERQLHEVPYHRQQDGRVERGIIDALYLRGGRWTVVDFKTDRLRSRADRERAIVQYEAQVGRYGTAVKQLLGQSPRLLLCFLNDAGYIQLEHL